MNDCKLILEIRDGQILFRAEGTSLVELAFMCGALEQITGLEAFCRGKPLDDIKSDMLGIHLEAMGTLEEQIEQEKGIIPPDKPKLNRKKFIEEAMSE